MSTSIIYMTTEEYLNIYLPEVEFEKDDVYLVTSEGEYVVRGNYSNVAVLDNTILAATAPIQNEANPLEPLLMERYIRIYLEHLDDKSHREVFSMMIVEAIKSDKNIVLLTSRREGEDLQYFYVWKKWIKQTFGIDAYHYEDYFIKGEETAIPHPEQVLHGLRGEFAHVNRGALNDIRDAIYCPHNPRVYVTKDELLSLNPVDILEIAMDMGIDVGELVEGKIEDTQAKWLVIEAIMNQSISDVKHELDDEDINQLTIDELAYFAGRCGLMIPDGYTKKEAIRLITNKIERFGNEIDKYNERSLSKMQNY